MKLLMYVLLALAPLPAAMASDVVQLSSKLSLNGNVVSEPHARFKLNNHFDMTIENSNRRIRLSMFARKSGEEAIDLRVQLFESDASGVWTLLGEPRITAATGGEFSIETRTEAGGGYRLEGTIDRLSADVEVLSKCPSVDGDFLQCSVESRNWLQLAAADDSSVLGSCCTRNCRFGTITCCGGCCSDPANCTVGCCPE